MNNPKKINANITIENLSTEEEADFKKLVDIICRAFTKEIPDSITLPVSPNLQQKKAFLMSLTPPQLAEFTNEINNRCIKFGAELDKLLSHALLLSNRNQQIILLLLYDENFDRCWKLGESSTVYNASSLSIDKGVMH